MSLFNATDPSDSIEVNSGSGAGAGSGSGAGSPMIPSLLTSTPNCVSAV